MRKLFSISSSQAPILVTLFTVILLGVIYLLVYIPQNENEVKEQRFRSLQRVDDNVHEKINNSIALMDGLLRASFNSQIRDTSYSFQQYIEHYDSSNFHPLPRLRRQSTQLL
jgi:chaperone required for assembly of F1-ATPase